MQLNDRPPLRLALAAAAGALVSATPYTAADNWELGSNLSLYNEQGPGIHSISPSVELTRILPDQQRLQLRATVDSVSGASPTGASGAHQTLTSPSGHAVSSDSGSGLVYDTNFHDQREALNVSWDSRLNSNTTYTTSGAFSTERDFTSATAQLSVARSLLRNNLTLGLGGSWEADEVRPIGGRPQAFTLNGGSAAKLGDAGRHTGEVLFSLTAALSPHTLAYLNLGLSRSGGYLTDPYKMITVVDGQTGLPVDAALFDNSITPGTQFANLYESRPDERYQQDLYLQLNQALGEHSLQLGYRYTHDDWGVNSVTVDTHFHWQVAEKIYLQPELRWYTQTAAYFYRYALVDNVDISGSQINIRYVSADRRLAEFNAETVGLRAGWQASPQWECTLQVDEYQQHGNGHPDNAIGAEKSIDFFPILRAWMIQAGLIVRW